MDSQRLILFFVFSFSVFLLLDAWQRDQRSEPAPTPQTTQKGEQPALPRPSEKLVASQAAKPPEGSAVLAPGQTIKVETDFLRAEISTQGGDLRRLELKRHRDTLEKSKNFELFQDQPDQVYVAQSGLLGNALPNHRTVFAARAGGYRLAEGAKIVELRLDAPEVNGIKVAKVYRFHRASYVVDVGYEIFNHSAAAIQPFAYFQLLRDSKPPAGDSAMLPTYTGAAVYTDKEKFQKVAFADIDKGKAPYPKNSNDGWIAILQHYFFSAWLPKNGTPREFYMRRLDGGLYAAGVIVPAGSIEPGKSTMLAVPLYAGPQEQDKLDKLAPGLDLTVDYGWLTIIAVPLFWVLAWINQWVGNWGIAIILLTVIIKLLFYPLSEASYRSMARMRVLAPRLQKIKEQYGDDRQRMQQAMMEIYKTEKINPLGGCLPIVVQIPVFIALYWVLLASVELRHAPFMLWIDDLASPDPWFILPIVMGATMIIQTKLNPEPPDPVQAKVMKIMPIAFSVFFFFFPAGLVLYWLVNNVLSIAQQWHINRVLERANLKPSSKA
ncbi:MAG: membrane protein insertase YidC [Betaproteobacteria bacterium RIFCSPLOWO2_12_FULL_62_13]|nr:MAG: membrane protein insertase YidC [Betaproteobacteria bacterium RIFCSPLOWO2_12_FULL_62_13]